MSPVADGEQLWRLTVESSPVGMMLVGLDGRLLTANRAICDMLGYAEEELQGLTFQEITHPDDIEADLALVAATLAGERSSYRMRKRYLHADGHVVWGDLSVVLLRGDDDVPIHFISQILDVSEQERNAERLAATSRLLDHQRRRLEAVIESVDVGLVVLDVSGNYEIVNRRHGFLMRLAYPDGHDGVAGQEGEVYAEDGATRLTRGELPSYRAATGEQFDDVRVWMGSDPLTRRACSVSARPVREPDGTFSGAVLAYADVTDYMRALHAKDEFVAAVSHELRTPMTSVLGYLEMLTERDDLPRDAIVGLRVVERNAVRLRDLVADLIDVAQMAEGRLQLSRAPAGLDRLLVEAVEAARPTAAAAEVALELQAPVGVVLEVDGQRVRQVVDNLISNAIKYTEPGGHVLVVLEGGEGGEPGRPDDEVAVVVTDTGIGIDASELDGLFARFVRGERAQARMVPGAGLGLSIVEWIVAAHGGRVEVDSTPGEGSTFRVVLPR